MPGAELDCLPVEGMNVFLEAMAQETEHTDTGLELALKNMLC